MVYPDNNQLLNDAYVFISASTNLDEVKRMIECCADGGLELLEYTPAAGQRKQHLHRQRQRAANSNANANASASARRGYYYTHTNHHFTNNYNYQHMTAFGQICARRSSHDCSRGTCSSTNDELLVVDDDLNILKYMLQKHYELNAAVCSSSSSSNDKNNNMKKKRKSANYRPSLIYGQIGQKVRTDDSSSLSSLGTLLIESAIHILVKQSRIDILTYFATHSITGTQIIIPNLPLQQNKNHHARKTYYNKHHNTAIHINWEQRPLLTSQDVVDHGLIYTCIQNQLHEMCRFFLSSSLSNLLYHPSMIMNTTILEHKLEMIIMTIHSKKKKEKKKEKSSNNKEKKQYTSSSSSSSSPTRRMMEDNCNNIQKSLPLHMSCQYYNTHNMEFWKQTFPILLEKGLEVCEFYRRKYNQHVNWSLQKKKLQQQQRQQQTKKSSSKIKHHRTKKNHHQDVEKNEIQLCHYIMTSIGGLFIKDDMNCTPFDIIIAKKNGLSSSSSSTSSLSSSTSSSLSLEGMIQDAIQCMVENTGRILLHRPLLQGLIIHNCYYKDTTATLSSSQHQQQHNISSSNNNNNMTKQLPSYIKAILHHFPSSIQTKDNDNNLPIHIGAKYKLKWLDGMKDIVHAYMSGIQLCDGEYNFMPFMLAAATSFIIHGEEDEDEEEEEENEENDDDCDLDTIYSLLRYWPDAIFIDRIEPYDVDDVSKSHNKDYNVALIMKKQRSNRRRRRRSRKKRKKIIDQEKRNSVQD